MADVENKKKMTTKLNGVEFTSRQVCIICKEEAFK